MTKKLLLIVFLALNIAGCFKLGPDYRTPDTGINIPPAYKNQPEITEIKGASDCNWWKEFNDPQLNRIVQEAIRNNHDIRLASERIVELRSYLVRKRADRYPEIDMSASFEKKRYTTESLEIGRRGMSMVQKRTTLKSHTLSLPASFELDLWGRLSRAEESARANLLEAEENKRTIIQGIVAEAVSLYLRIQCLERKIEIQKKSIEDYKRSLELVEMRYRLGLSNILDLKQAKRTLLSAEAELPPLRQELALVQHQLSVLLGRYPDSIKPKSSVKDHFYKLPPIPRGIPSELLLTRPDIRAQEAKLISANAQIGVAIASRFPRITLTGSFGYTSEELQSLLKPESEFSKLAMGIFHPLFDFGRLKAEQKAVESRYRQQVISYAKTVLGAFEEVESAFVKRRELLKTRKRVISLLREAKEAQEIAKERYLKGLTTYLNVLEAQQKRYSIEKSLSDIEYQILSNRVSLHRALGGRWPCDGYKRGALKNVEATSR